MVRMTTRLLCIVAVFIIFIPLYLILNYSDHAATIDTYFKRKTYTEEERLEKSYGVIMDAGSTGTRLFLYTWTSNSDNELIKISPALDHSNNHVVKKVYPGLSSFENRPEEAAEYVKPLLDYASQFIPSEKLPYTPVFLFATAGMRLISEKQQNAILSNLHAKLPKMTQMQVMKEHIRVIEGKWEGIYSWIAVNYILGNFKAVSLLNATRPETVGMIDMGGASMQIAFEMPPKDEFRSGNVESVNLGCRDDDDKYKYKLFVATFLGYGVNEGLRKYEQELSDRLLTNNSSYVRDECMPVNLQKIINRSDGTMFVRKGVGNWDECVKQVVHLLKKSEMHSKPNCNPNCFFGNVAAPSISLSTMKLYGFSEYWYSLDEVLSLGGNYNYTVISGKSKHFCSQRWSAIQAAVRRKLYRKANDERLKSQCFKSAWITAVLHDGFHVDREHNNFQSASNIAGQEVQWALGAMIYHMRYFPLRNSASNQFISRHAYDSSLPSASALWILVLAMLTMCGLFTVVILKEDISVGMRRNRSFWTYMMINSNDTSSYSSLRSIRYG